MRIETSSKRLQWVNCGSYYTTVCGQYYAYKEGGLWQAGRVMFGRDINYRVSFPNMASARAFLQEQESQKVLIIGEAK